MAVLQCADEFGILSCWQPGMRCTYSMSIFIHTLIVSIWWVCGCKHMLWTPYKKKKKGGGGAFTCLLLVVIVGICYWSWHGFRGALWAKCRKSSEIQCMFEHNGNPCCLSLCFTEGTYPDILGCSNTVMWLCIFFHLLMFIQKRMGA